MTIGFRGDLRGGRRYGASVPKQPSGGGRDTHRSRCPLRVQIDPVDAQREIARCARSRLWPVGEVSLIH
jgi:hypothetical protein